MMTTIELNSTAAAAARSRGLMLDAMLERIVWRMHQLARHDTPETLYRRFLMATASRASTSIGRVGGWKLAPAPDATAKTSGPWLH